MSIINHNISVSIDGRRLFSFKSLELRQPLNDHHSFELRGCLSSRDLNENSRLPSMLTEI